MVKHNTVGRRFNPVRSKKRRSRRRKSRYSERSKADDMNTKCVTITLRDVGDIDDKELNTIPSSVLGETSSWGDNPEDKINADSFASYTNPLLQVQSANFCQLCTKKLVDIHENDTGGTGDVCNHEGNGDELRRKKVAQSILKVFQSITEGKFDESNMSVVQSKVNSEQGRENSKIHRRLIEKKCRTLSKAMNTSNREIKCSLSRLSIQVMCTSESTLSTGLTQDNNPGLLWPQQTKLKSESTMTKSKLETVAGALLMELCKVTAEKMDGKIEAASQKKMLLAKDSYMPRLKNARHGRPATGYSALDARLPDWLRELCQEEDPRKPKKGILKKHGSQIVKSKVSTFRPLLCTKLSFPWIFRKSLPQITCKKQHESGNALKQQSSSVVKHIKNEHHRNNRDRRREEKKEDYIEPARRESKCSNRAGTTVVHAYDTRSVRYRSSDSVVPFQETPAPADVPLRLFGSKTVRDVKPGKKKRAERQEDSFEERDSKRDSSSLQDCGGAGRIKEKRIKDVCPKCQSSIHCSIELRTDSPKLRKTRTKPHNVLAYPCKKILKKAKPTSRQEKGHWHQVERRDVKTRQYNRNPTTKYFIKSFFTGTSTSETTKPPVKTTKKAGRRRKLVVPPRSAGRAIPHECKKRRASPTPRSSRRRHHKIVDKDDSRSDIELEIQASKEMDIINQHIRAHNTASGSSPVFHTCFKHLLDKELKAQSGQDGRPTKSRKFSKGGYLLSRPLPEIRKYNEGIFSCLIPKVFK